MPSPQIMAHPWIESANKERFYPEQDYLLIKRGMDLTGALLGLMVLAPLFILIAVLIKSSSPGPVFYLQERIGQYGRKFKIYKFRTMVQNAEELIQRFTPEQQKEFYENFKVKEDPRISGVGKILRKTSLDELPQLLNILKGEMSFVGPRPVVEEELEKYGEHVDTFLSVVPGLTGMWQANGRSDTTYEERVQMDVDYVRNRNLMLDIRIILKTFVEVFRCRSAY